MLGRCFGNKPQPTLTEFSPHSWYLWPVFLPLVFSVISMEVGIITVPAHVRCSVGECGNDSVSLAYYSLEWPQCHTVEHQLEGSMRGWRQQFSMSHLTSCPLRAIRRSFITLLCLVPSRPSDSFFSSLFTTS